MFNSSIQFLGNISEKIINLVTPVTKSVKGIPNAFAIGYTQSKINRHNKARFKAEQSIALAQAKSKLHSGSNQGELDLA